MAGNILSQPPLTVQMLEADGRLNRTWSIWFRDVYGRVGAGGSNQVTLNAEAIAILQPKPRDVTANLAAEQYEFLSVTCSVSDITITLPDASLTPGASIWIHKVDDTQYKVLTEVGDIFFQGTTIHLMSNGLTWVIS